MRTLLAGVLGCVLLAPVAYAGCGSDPGDEQKVIDARTMAEEQCTMQGNGCLNAPTHGAYVSCVAGVAKTLATSKALPQSCTGKVKKCAAKSACGQDKITKGFVTCCVTTKKGPKCKLKSSATGCTAKGSLNPTHTSCCSNTHPLTEDACMASPSGAFLN
jgi:hypothetical protein